MKRKEYGYSTKDVSDGRRFLSCEESCIATVRHQDIKATEWAFRFGQKLWVDILKKRRGTRNQGVLKSYLKAVDFKGDPKNAYRYIALYRAAGSLNTVRTSGLSRAYLTKVGQALWTNNPLVDGIAVRLVQNPIRKKTEAETLAALDEVCKVIKDARTRIGKLKSLEILGSEPYRGGRRCEISGDYDEMQKLLNIHVQIEQDVARLTGRHDKAFVVSDSSGFYGVRTPADMGEAHNAKGLINIAHRRESIKDIVREASETDIREIDRELILGDALRVLKDQKLFPERSVDCVLTDPPYSDEDYEPEREHTRVRHRAPATTIEAAKLAADVAKLVLERKINRTRFSWIQFCPLRKVHIFLPALLATFDEVGLKPDYQVLVWDKEIPARVGGMETFGSQAEAILYVNVGRPLPVADSHGGRIFSPIFRVRQLKRGKGLDLWKPVELLEKILWLAMYGSDKSTQAAKQRVLDPFAGRGSAGIAAMRLGRQFSLIEIDEGQYGAAKANLLGEKKSLASQSRSKS